VPAAPAPCAWSNPITAAVASLPNRFITNLRRPFGVSSLLARRIGPDLDPTAPCYDDESFGGNPPSGNDRSGSRESLRAARVRPLRLLGRGRTLRADMRSPSPRRVRPRHRAAALALAIAALALLPASARAGGRPHRYGGDEGNGRVFDAERMRPGRTSAPSGRYMRRPDVPEPDAMRPLRSTAAIPDPTPRLKGGSRYSRQGDYFFATASDPQLTRKTSKQQYRNLIPSPEVVESGRKRSAATR